MGGGGSSQPPFVQEGLRTDLVLCKQEVIARDQMGCFEMNMEHSVSHENVDKISLSHSLTFSMPLSLCSIVTRSNRHNVKWSHHQLP